MKINKLAILMSNIKKENNKYNFDWKNDYNIILNISLILKKIMLFKNVSENF